MAKYEKSLYQRAFFYLYPEPERQFPTKALIWHLAPEKPQLVRVYHFGTLKRF